jgi:hypothetical protein
MNELLKQYGFEYSGGCSCDGHTTHKYKKDGYQIKHRVRQNTFRIKKDGRSLTGWIKMSELENKLNEFHTENIPA